jgi:uncharacterized protein GlcG (DUF336 family)
MLARLSVLLLVAVLALGGPYGPAWATDKDKDDDEKNAKRGHAGLSAGQADALFTACQTAAAQTPSGGFRPVTLHTIMWCAVVDREGRLLLIRATDTGEDPGAVLETDAWRASIEIAIAKAYTGLAFSNNELAVTSRAIGLLARTDFPNVGGDIGTDRGPAPLFGIGHTNPYRPLTGAVGLRPDDALNRKHHGIVTFAGGVPVYSNPEKLPNCTQGGGKLLGAVGVSGDGVDEDEAVAIGAIHLAGLCTGP